MLRRTLTIIIAGILWSTAVGYVPARAQAQQQSTPSAEKARAAVQKLGADSKTRVEVKLQDGTKLKGPISAAAEDAFTIKDSKTGAERTVAYADVAEVKKPGSGLSTRSWVIIGAAAAAAVIVGVTVIQPVLCDGGAGC